MLVKIHAPDSKHGKVIKHDCRGFPDEPKYAQFKASHPYLFRDGDEVDLPDDVADYFMRAGWAAKDGEQPVKPDPGKTVFVQAHNSKLGHRRGKPPEVSTNQPG